MRHRRMSLAWGTFLLVGAVIGGTVGHGAYHRSDRYRRKVQADLTAFFGLPVDVGSIEPHSFTARQLCTVELWLPDRRARIFHCPRAVWDEAGGGEVVGGLIDVMNADLTIGSEAWESDDYMRVLRASLQHNFLDLNIRAVRFHDARLTWPRKDFRLTAEAVNGRILFDDDGGGQAELTADALNGTRVDEPIRIKARIDPLSDELIPEVTLQVPTLSLATLGIDQMLRSRITQGSFAGRITLRQSGGSEEIQLAGLADAVRLEELTAGMAGGAVPGEASLTIVDALIRGRRLDHIRFSGEVHELDVDALLSRLGLPPIGGRVHLTLLAGWADQTSIQHLRAAGEWVDGSLDALARAVLGRTGVHGRLRVRVHSLVIENNAVDSGDVEVIAEPPPGGRGTIDRSLLTDLIRKHLGVSLPESLLPPRIEYVQLGMRLIISPDRIRLLSGRGPAGPALITARILNQDFPLLGDLDVSFPIDPILDQARKQVDGLRGTWRQRLREQRPAASQPGQNEG